MLEGPPKNKKEDPINPLEFSYDERLKSFMDMHPEIVPVLESSKPRESGPEIAELDSMINEYKEKHDLSALNSILHIGSVEEARSHPVREPVRIGFATLYNKLKVLALETNITGEQYEPLEQRVDEISRAIGIVTRDWSVDHSKRMERGFYFPNR